MATESGLFYAYAKNIRDDLTYRYLIVFANRSTADNWWRAVSDSVAAGYQRFAAVQRVSHQFYTHDPFVGSVIETTNDDRCAKQFQGKMLFTLISNRDAAVNWSIAPVLNYTDHSSGDAYFIRSVLQPYRYWYCYIVSPGSTTDVHAHHDRRTKFTIRIAEQKKPGGTIMIGSDDIVIGLKLDSSIFIGLGADCNVGVGGGVKLTTVRQEFTFKFSDFDGRFQVNRVTQSNGLAADIVVKNPGGERWEIVV